MSEPAYVVGAERYLVEGRTLAASSVNERVRWHAVEPGGQRAVCGTAVSVDGQDPWTSTPTLARMNLCPVCRRVART